MQRLLINMHAVLQSLAFLQGMSAIREGDITRRLFVVLFDTEYSGDFNVIVHPGTQVNVSFMARTSHQIFSFTNVVTWLLKSSSTSDLALDRYTNYISKYVLSSLFV